MGVGVRDRVVEKLIALLKTSELVTKYVGSGASARIYGSHLSTITDWKLPAVSIHILNSSGRMVGGMFGDQLEIQVEPWFNAVGKNSFVWDDVFECHAGIADILHHAQGWDNSIGIKIFEIAMISKGPQLQDPDGMMHLPSRWRIMATV